jgi:hypothetical protein
MHKVQTTYNSCIVKGSENICSDNGGSQDKGKTRWSSILWISIPLL